MKLFFTGLFTGLLLAVFATAGGLMFYDVTLYDRKPVTLASESHEEDYDDGITLAGKPPTMKVGQGCAKNGYPKCP